MPFYEYHCANCGHHHEELQKITDKPLRKCPSCGKNTLKRLVSAPVFRLKGGGWYETDFKSDKERKRNLAGEKEPAPAAESGATPKPPPAAKAEGKPATAESKPEKKEPSGKTTVAVKKPAGSAAKKPAAKATRAAGRRK